MDKDKAIRSAKLTAAGLLDKARARTAVTRAGGQIAPSKYLPNVPRQVHADGGKVAFMQGNHPDVPEVVYHGTNSDFTAFRPEGIHWFTSDKMDAADYKPKRIVEAHLSLKNPADLDAPKIKSVLRKNGFDPENLYDLTQDGEKVKALLSSLGHDGMMVSRPDVDKGVMHYAAFHPHQIKSAIGNQGTFDPNDPDITKAEGGRIHAEGGGKMELRSRAAEAIRNQPQLKGSVDQLLAVTAKGKGVKQAELANAGRPSGNIISKEELARHFEEAVPDVGVERLGGRNDGLSPEEEKEFSSMTAPGAPYPTGAAMERYRHLSKKLNVAPTRYGQYALPGGENYREHLLHLPENLPNQNPREIELREQQEEASKNRDYEGLDRIGAELEKIRSAKPNFRSTHWYTPNVLAHVRMDDRDNGKTLHVQEVQSDWGQEGRERGFYDPKKPIEVFHTGTGETVHATDDMGEAKAKAEQLGPQYDYGRQDDEKPPQGPYVGNTQQWTDLALKHALTEAAKGGHDRVVFSPGEANADLYGQRQPISSASLHVPLGMTDALGYLYTQDRDSGASFDPIHIKDEKELVSQLGRNHAKALLSQEPTTFGGTSSRTISEPDMHLGGHGMVDYYNNIVHPSALKLLQQHDPSIKPESYDLPNGYKGFSLPMTDTARQSILKNGFGAFKRGGTVGKAGGGEVDSVESNNQNGVEENEVGTAPLNLAPRAQAGELRDAGGVRRGLGVLQAPNEASLEGLPTKVSIPLTGGSVSAGHDPRIRQIARDYMASTGLPYNPPTKYAKVDPKRASRIAAAYDEMKDNASDPLTKASYAAMIKETMAQYHAAKNAGFKAEFWNPDTEEDPYKASPRLATEDVRNNHHMWVYPTRSGYGSDGPITAKELEENPLLQDSGETWNGQPATVNDIFRAVHDYYGHAKEGVGFRGDGEENAWRSHASMYSPLARMAMTTETRGQNSWLNYGVYGEKNRNARTEDTVFAPQKVGILPHWAHHEGAEDFMGPEEVNAMAAIRKVHGRAKGGAVDDDNPAPVIQNPMSIFPKPQRMFPEDQRPKGGQYISAHNKADVTGHKAEAATIGIGLNGKPFFQASQNAVDQTGTAGKGSATTKTNLFKQKAGWKWQDAPEGHENTETIVSVEHRGKHFYALNAHFPKGVDLARYENATSEPRLRPTTQGNVTLGPQAGSISVRGKMHPVYHHVIVKADGGAVDAALALTRRFTKDGKAATMALKPKGK